MNKVVHLIKLTSISLLTLLWVVLPVYAVSTSNAAYIADVVTINTGETTSKVATICSINTEALINGKYVTSDFKNSALQTPEEADIPYMPGVGSNPWVFLIPSIAANEQKCYSFYAGGPPMQTGTGIVYFPNTNGMTVADDDSIELGNNFEVKFQGFIDTSAGSNKNLVFKDVAFKVWVSGEKEISASIYKDGGWTGCVVTATNVLTDIHFIQVTADVQDLKLYLDGNLKDTEALSGTSVPPNENGWSFCTNGSMLYLEYLQIWVD